jgi:hypothetical protein
MHENAEVEVEYVGRGRAPVKAVICDDCGGEWSLSQWERILATRPPETPGGDEDGGQ